MESSLFKVDRRYFEQSEIFKTIFSLPTGDEGAEGSSDYDPFIFEGIKTDDFRSFLSVLL